MTETANNTASADARNSRSVVQGIVSSAGMDKTISVRVERMFKHPKYKKYIRRHSKVHAHDETNECMVGDVVELMECRPMSKSKRYRLVRIVERPSLPAGAVKPTEVQAAATADAMGSEDDAADFGQEVQS